MMGPGQEQSDGSCPVRWERQHAWPRLASLAMDGHDGFRGIRGSELIDRDV